MTIKITKAEINNICQQIDDSQISRINQFVIFVGHAHSGHSLIGALLDSHIQSAISNHVNVPKLLVDHQLTKVQLLKVVLYYSLKNNDKEAWVNTGYNYQTNNSHQGKVTHPFVLGDKQGGASTRVIMNNSEVVKTLKEMFGDQLKVVFVYRNVFDNIAAFSHYMKEDLSEKHINRYFENLETTLNLKNQIAKDQWLQMSHEQFIIEPDENLKALFDFVNLDYTEDSIKSLIQIVNRKPHQRSKSIKWDEKYVSIINEKLQGYHL